MFEASMMKPIFAPRFTRIQCRWHCRAPRAARVVKNRLTNTEIMASILTLDYLRVQAAQGKRSEVERFLVAVPE
jgi:hypothetical protein